jgi:serine/threonine protein kinase
LARCLNPRSGEGHENPDNAVSCQRCDFLVQGAHIGTYEVVSFIGAGSYGYVYKVREPNPLGRILALKVLRLDQFTDKAQASFFQEARRIANLQHPNILPVYNFGQIEESEQPYLVMEYAPLTIFDIFRLNDGKRRNAYAEELIPYIQQAADALHYVHNNGLIHQDVKPGNLLIGRNGQILLSDFGTTFYLGMQTHASLGEVTGTAAYMPPEQWQGAPRRDSDQYALAICCYELLAGRPPFVYKRLEEIWSAHQKEVPPSPQNWNTRIPVEVSAVLQRAMSKDYRQRYPSILKFAESFTSAVQLAQMRYLCHRCGQQNRTGAQRCSSCGATQDNRTCPYCDAPVRFGQRCCSHCGRLTIPTDLVEHSPLIGTTLRQGRYTLKRVLKQSEETGIMVVVATDEREHNKSVILKRWECADQPLSQRARDVAHYERATTQLSRLKHPLLPQVLDRFAEGRHYYLVESYIDGETLEERQQKLLRPLPEREVLSYFNSLLNVLIFLEQQQPPIRHYDITPSTILIDAARGRAILTGFQIPPPSLPADSKVRPERFRRRTTRKLAISPYLPIQDKPFDQRTCLYALAACMHQALTAVAPPHYPNYPPVRLLNPTISPGLEMLLSRALLEDSRNRYQNYQTLRIDIQKLLASSHP